MADAEQQRDETDFRGADVPEEAREALRRAMQLMAQGQVDAALEQGRAVIERWPEFGQAHGWLGQTLVTRKRRFADGLEVLERAEALASDDPYVLYSVGWCREFVANELARPKRAHQPVEPSAGDLYARARDTFLRALELEPDDQLQGDIEDMLDVISNVTGEPWSDVEVGRAQPRPR
jgi:tetratricopeptide (TPR) repeat protein